MKGLDSQLFQTLSIQGKDHKYLSLQALQQFVPQIASLPFSLKVLLENVLRFTPIENVIEVTKNFYNSYFLKSHLPIDFRPARVLMQDFTGVPAIVDFAAMREAMKQHNKDPQKINPFVPVDLIIDHSVTVDVYGNNQAYKENVSREFERNQERYTFLKWAQKSFRNFRVVPPGTGICHQVNLEFLGQVVWFDEQENFLYPDTLVGTDSHTTMINALGILGWGVGGIEAEAAMLNQAISMLVPEVIGVKLSGKLPEGSTSTDLVLTITQLLRNHGVVGKFVEFCGEGLDHLSIEERATVSNMCPEFGATCAFFPVDQKTLEYFSLTGRPQNLQERVKAYCKEQQLWRTHLIPEFSTLLELNLNTVIPSLSGPKRPQDRVNLDQVPHSCKEALTDIDIKPVSVQITSHQTTFHLHHGDVVIAAITSCTNTSNPSILIGAGLLARKARNLGLHTKPWVKTSLAPGSQVVTEYLRASGLLSDLEALGFYIVGYGCTTCIGNSGPLEEPIAKAIDGNNLSVGAVLSGNRNFEGRVHPQVRLNYLASPPLVVAYALVGNLRTDLTKDPIGNVNGKDVYLKDIWPTTSEIQEILKNFVSREMFVQKYADVFEGTDLWKSISIDESVTYNWNPESTYIQCPPYFENIHNQDLEISDIQNAHILGMYGDSITTDHISPAGNIRATSPAGLFLQEQNTPPEDFNSYGARRGNHLVMMRGTFANIRLKNELTPNTAGNWTKHIPSQKERSLFEASNLYHTENKPVVIVAGKEYGAGSSRDWAAKGPYLLGVKAVIAESFERIHRSNLIGMGILPLTFTQGMNRQILCLTGQEAWSLQAPQKFSTDMVIQAKLHIDDNQTKDIPLQLQVITPQEFEYLRHGGIMPYVLRGVMGQ